MHRQARHRFAWNRDFTEEFRGSGSKVFSGRDSRACVGQGAHAKARGATQGQIETMTEHAKSFGAKGLAYIKVENGEWKSPIVKFFKDAEKAALTKKSLASRKAI